MRPGDFSPGNASNSVSKLIVAAVASMRPGDFSPGNQRSSRTSGYDFRYCFNEAGGFLPRKLYETESGQR